MTELNTYILSLLIGVPLAGALLVALLPRAIARQGALAVAAINFVLSLHLIAHWALGPLVNNGDAPFQFQVNLPWVPSLGIHYHLGVDGISVLLVLLTTFLTPIVLLSSWHSITQRVKEYVVTMLLLEAAIIGVFCALDVILFYVCYEAVLIPAYFLVGVWGGAGRKRAAIKFFIYTMAGSVLMWVAILVLYMAQPVAGRSFDYTAMLNAAHDLSYSPWAAWAPWAFGAFVVAFAIKAPLFPLHTWLPNTYSEAPTGATVLIAALLSKMGIYGLLRFALPFFPDLSRLIAPTMIALAAVSIIYGSLVALRQDSIKRLLAYSSVAHIGLIVLGVFAATLAPNYAAIAFSGVALQMVSHGLSTGALFLLAGFLHERSGTYRISDLTGVAGPMPRFTVLFWVALFASIGLPGLNGFVGEYLILQGSMDAGFAYAALGATGVILGAIYMLRMFRQVMFGDANPAAQGLRDVSPRESLVLVLVAVLMVWIGVAPQRFLNIINPDAAQVMTPGHSNEE